jgi:hypothetical protein
MPFLGGLGRFVSRAIPGAIGGFIQGGPMGAVAGGLMTGLSGGGGGGGGDGGGGGGGGGGGQAQAIQQAQAQANQYLGQIPGVGERYLNPFIQQGPQAQQQAQDVYGRMLEQYSSPNVNYQNVPEEYNRMAGHPAEFLNNIMSSYSPSAGYQYKQNKMMGAARNSAASGGFAGTRYDQEQQAQLMKDLLSEDMQQYLNNVMEAKGAGLEGMERMMGGREKAYGAQALSAEERAKRAHEAAESLATSIMSAYAGQGNLAYQGGLSAANARQSASNRRDSLLTNILGPAVTGGGGWFGQGQGGNNFAGMPRVWNNPNTRMPAAGGGLSFRPARFGGGTPNTGFAGIGHAGGYLR